MNKNRNWVLQSAGGINALKRRYPQLNERLIRNIAATFPVSGRRIDKNLKSLNNELQKHQVIAAIPGVRRQGVHKRPTKAPKRAITVNQLANMLNMVTIVPPKNRSLENVMKRLRVRR